MRQTFASRVHSDSNIESICQNVKILQNTPLPHTHTKFVIFIALLDVKAILIFLRITKMADKLFLTSVSGFDEGSFYIQM
jgi:hypothetical protein